MKKYAQFQSEVQRRLDCCNFAVCVQTRLTEVVVVVVV